MLFPYAASPNVSSLWARTWRTNEPSICTDMDGVYYFWLLAARGRGGCRYDLCTTSDALSPLVVFAGGYAIGSYERNVSYICEASVHDETLVVHTTVQYEEHVVWCGGPDVALITGMSPWAELEPLDAGTYSIQYAGRTVDVTLPNPDASCDSVL